MRRGCRRCRFHRARDHLVRNRPHVERAHRAPQLDDVDSGDREQVFLRRPDQRARAVLTRDAFEPAHDRDRDAVGLAHDELGGAGDFVGDRDDRRFQLHAERVLLAPVIAHGFDACDPERDVRLPDTPRAAEGVRDDHADVPSQSRAQPLGRAVGVERQQREAAGLNVRRVDACVRAHEAVARLRNDDFAAARDDSRGLLNDGLRTFLPSVRGVDLDDPAFGLADDLLRDDDDVTVSQLGVRRDQLGEVVTIGDLGQSRYRDDFDPHRARSASARVAFASAAASSGVCIIVCVVSTTGPSRSISSRAPPSTTSITNPFKKSR